MTVEDVHTTNGTFINDKELAMADARAGDVLQFGDAPFLVAYT